MNDTASVSSGSPVYPISRSDADFPPYSPPLRRHRSGADDESTRSVLRRGITVCGAWPSEAYAVLAADTRAVAVMAVQAFNTLGTFGRGTAVPVVKGCWSWFSAMDPGDD